MVDRALEWWSRRPLWQCGLAFVGGWLFLGGLGQLVMLPLAGMCVFPLVVRVANDPDAILDKAKGLWRNFLQGFHEGEDYAPEHDVERGTTCPEVHEHHHEPEGPATLSQPDDPYAWVPASVAATAAPRMLRPPSAPARQVARATAAPRPVERTLV